MTYAEKLKDPRWQKKRLHILNRDKWKCKLCFDETKTLHVHHRKYMNGANPWDVENKFLITLCEDCHIEVESFKKLGVIIDPTLSPKSFFKSGDWDNNSRIMFSATAEGLCMRIYDPDGEKIIGYTFGRDSMYKINQLIVRMQKHGEELFLKNPVKENG